MVNMVTYDEMHTNPISTSMKEYLECWMRTDLNDLWKLDWQQ